MQSDMSVRAIRETLSVAPMMEYTTRHYRYMFRRISRRTTLYTEMVVSNTIRHAPDLRRHLSFDPVEKPIICQIGGSDPEELAHAAKVCEAWGYDEVNLNVGCPSERVAGNSFGCALMLEPDLVRRCMAAMKEAVDIPVTVKCRLGADDMDSYDELKNFIEVVSQSGVKHFIVHARKAWLKGLNPSQNRTVPPLRYHWVFRLAEDFPHLDISINGGLATVDGVQQALNLTFDDFPRQGKSDDAYWHGGGNEEKVTRQRALRAKESPEEAILNEAGVFGEEDLVAWKAPTGSEMVTATSDSCSSEEASSASATDPMPPAAAPAAEADTTAAAHSAPKGARHLLHSVMVGRAAYHHPWRWRHADSLFFGEPDPGLSRRQILVEYCDYCDQQQEIDEDGNIGNPGLSGPMLLKPIPHLFAGERGAGAFRRAISNGMSGCKGTFRASDLLRTAMEALPDEVLDAL